MNSSTERRLRYPWQRELDEWNESRQDEIREQVLEMKTVAEMNYDPVPPESIIKYAEAAHAQPEVWEVILRFAEQRKIDPNGNADNDDATNEDIAFVGQFQSWYLMKNRSKDHSLPYGNATGLLVEVAMGKIKKIKSKESIEYLRQFPFVEK